MEELFLSDYWGNMFAEFLYCLLNGPEPKSILEKGAFNFFIEIWSLYDAAGRYESGFSNELFALMGIPGGK